MKESDRKYFQTIAEIDYWKWIVIRASEELGKIKPKSVIEILVDRACNYKESFNIKEIARIVAHAFKEIVILKKSINIDPSLEEKELATLEDFLLKKQPRRHNGSN